MRSEQEEFNRGRMLRKERKVHPLFIRHRTQRMYSPRFYLVYLLCHRRYHLYSTPFSSIAHKSAAYSVKRPNRPICVPAESTIKLYHIAELPCQQAPRIREYEFLATQPHHPVTTTHP